MVVAKDPGADSDPVLGVGEDDATGGGARTSGGETSEAALEAEAGVSGAPVSSNGGDDRRGLFGLLRDNSRGEIKELKQRIGELERTVAELRRRKDLADLDEVELTELASQTAVAMVKAAKARQDEAVSSTEELLGEARTTAAAIRSRSEEEAERLLDAARREVEDLQQRSTAEAKQRVAEAREEADRTRQEAQEFADDLRQRSTSEADELLTGARSEAETTVADARDQAARIVDRAEQDAAEIIEQAASERDDLLEAMARQREWIVELLQQVETLRRAATDAFTDVRTQLDTALTRLSAPTEQAEQVVSELDDEAERLRNLVPTVSADEGASTAEPHEQVDATRARSPSPAETSVPPDRQDDADGSAVVRVWSNRSEREDDAH